MQPQSQPFQPSFGAGKSKQNKPLEKHQSEEMDNQKTKIDQVDKSNDAGDGHHKEDQAEE